MNLAIASGKGGTGKTTLAVNLALCAGVPARYLDCDVEEPNGHLFLRPDLSERAPLALPVPVVTPERCDGCGRCAEVCRFNALAAVRSGLVIFPELCHACGGCLLACPRGALSEGRREIGVVESGFAGDLAFVHGRLRVGEALAPPLIRAVRKHATPERLNILDAPPGTSCPVIAAVRACDFVLLVTEPTPFGLHDLTLAVETVRELRLPFAVIVNRAGIGDDRVRRYCSRERVPLLAEIPEDRRIAEAYSRGQPAVAAVPGVSRVFRRILAAVKRTLRAAPSRGVLQ
jgi:MinD superfamily P-loop ATPase